MGSAGLTTPADGLLAQLVDFLTDIGLTVQLRPIDETTVLPGVSIDHGVLVIDAAALRFVGDVLHEAGHLAITPAVARSALHRNVGTDGGNEMATLAWTFAAARHLGIDLEVVFHEGGYRGGASALIENFEQGRYIGVPILVWRGLTTQSNYPAMESWVAR